MTTPNDLYDSSPLALADRATARLAVQRLSGTSGGMLGQEIADLFAGTKGTDVANSATPAIGAATGMFVHMLGATTITGFDTVAAGITRLLTFDAARTITYNGTSLILPGSADIVTAAGDSALLVSEGSGNWRCLAYWRRNGKPVIAVAVQAVTSSATVTPTFDDDLVKITAQAAALALANPTGTAVEGWGWAIRIKDNGTARAISFDTKYRAIGVTLPTTTVISKTLYLGCIYNATDDKVDVVAVSQEA